MVNVYTYIQKLGGKIVSVTTDLEDLENKLQTLPEEF